MKAQRIRLELGDELPAFVTLDIEEDGSATLTWNDGMVNEWSEDYASPSLALLRLAALARCGESDWHTSFTGDVDQFSRRANEYLGTEVS